MGIAAFDGGESIERGVLDWVWSACRCIIPASAAAGPDDGAALDSKLGEFPTSVSRGGSCGDIAEDGDF